MKHLFDSWSAYSLVQTQLLYMKYVKSRCQCWHESCWNNQILNFLFFFFKQDTNHSDGNIILGPISLPHTLPCFTLQGTTKNIVVIYLWATCKLSNNLHGQCVWSLGHKKILVFSWRRLIASIYYFQCCDETIWSPWSYPLEPIKSCIWSWS